MHAQRLAHWPVFDSFTAHTIGPGVQVLAHDGGDVLLTVPDLHVIDGLTVERARDSIDEAVAARARPGRVMAYRAGMVGALVAVVAWAVIAYPHSVVADWTVGNVLLAADAAIIAVLFLTVAWCAVRVRVAPTRREVAQAWVASHGVPVCDYPTVHALRLYVRVASHVGPEAARAGHEALLRAAARHDWAAITRTGEDLSHALSESRKMLAHRGIQGGRRASRGVTVRPGS